MGELTAVYIFGSVARGQHDSRSDLDLLAIVRDGFGKVDEEDVLSHVPAHLISLKAGISWYGQNRIVEMYKNGELFAWHLHAETTPLFEKQPFLTSLGKPMPYTEAAEDLRSFQNVMRGIPGQLKINEHNAVYEAGLVYVCLRNIAMAASSFLCAKPDFSRYSPFLLNDVDPCPISKAEYETTMACRMAGQRGLSPPSGVDSEFALNIFTRVEPWVEEVRLKLLQEGTVE
jgi:hypothetical protein